MVVKAQIHAGGRGKGGGVKLANSAEQAAEIAEKMLGMTLHTIQTGPEGHLVERLLAEEQRSRSTRSCTSASCWTVRWACRFSWRPKKAASKLKRWRQERRS